MTTSASRELLTLAQWFSPAFPLSSFAYSHGLETAINAGAVSDRDSLINWLEVLVVRGSGWVDAVLLCAANQGEDVAGLAQALTGSSERYEETQAQGAAFATVLRAQGFDVADAPLPVVIGCATRRFEMPTETICGLYLQNFVANLTQCAVRYLPLGQTQGQEVITRLASAVAVSAQKAPTDDVTTVGSGAFFSELAAMRHEVEPARVFRT